MIDLIFLLVVIFFVSIGLLLKRHFGFVFLLWFGHFWMALSSAYLESGSYITEQQRYSFYNGATLYLLFLEFFLWAGVWLVVTLSKHERHFRPVRLNKSGVWAVLLFVGVALFSLSVNLLLTGSPIFEDGLTRFNYWEKSAIPFLNKVFGDVAAPLLTMLGVTFALTKIERRPGRRVSLFMFYAFILYYFLIGHKFSMQVLAFSLFLPPVLYLSWAKLGSLGLRWTYFLKIGVGLGLLFVFIAWYYLEKHQGFVDEQGGVIEAVFYRVFALQGHVWWGGYNEFINGTELGVSAFDAISNGMQTMMYIVSPAPLVDAYLSAGVRFTMAYPAIALYAFGPLGVVVFQFIAGLLIGGWVIFCERQLLARRLYGSIFSLIVLSNVLLVFNMGNFSDLLSLKVVLPFFLLLILTIMSAGQYGWSKRM